MAGEIIGTRNNNMGKTNLELELERLHVTPPPIIVAYKPPKATEEYQKKFDPTKIPTYRPAKTVIISQSPPDGQFVPAGTEVKVTLTSKGSLPVGSFQVAPNYTAKYGAGNVEKVLTDLEEKGQTVIPILEQEKEYNVLSAAEKKAVTDYAHGVGIMVANEVDAQSFFEDTKFFYNF